MSIERLPASPDSDARAIAALTLAFVRDPVMRWLYPEPTEYLLHFPPFSQAFGGAAFPAGTAWASDDRGGAALWLPTNTDRDGDAIAAHVFATTVESKHETIGEVFEAMDAYHPDEPHWYLAIVGVDAAHQGKGLGAKLLAEALALCDAEGAPAYLESSNPANVSLYERHGFEVVGRIQKGDAPPMIPMYRRASR